MKWKHPPVAKIYEALGSIADKRLEITGNSAKVYSSSGNKFYTVTYDKSSESVMLNDNASFYKGYLGYPGIAFLMLVGELKYNPPIAEKLKGIAWKDLNQKFKNNFDETIKYILSTKSAEERVEIEEEVNQINEELKVKSYNLLGSKIKPPEGY